MIHNGYFTHPDLWMMWAAVILTPINTALVILSLLKNSRLARSECPAIK